MQSCHTNVVLLLSVTELCVLSSACAPACLPARLSVRPSVRPSVYPSVCLSMLVYRQSLRQQQVAYTGIYKTKSNSIKYSIGFIVEKRKKLIFYIQCTIQIPFACILIYTGSLGIKVWVAYIGLFSTQPGLCSMIYNVVSRHVSIDIVSYYSTSVECPSLTNKTSILE